MPLAQCQCQWHLPGPVTRKQLQLELELELEVQVEAQFQWHWQTRSPTVTQAPLTRSHPEASPFRVLLPVPPLAGWHHWHTSTRSQTCASAELPAAARRTLQVETPSPLQIEVARRRRSPIASSNFEPPAAARDGRFSTVVLPLPVADCEIPLGQVIRPLTPEHHKPCFILTQYRLSRQCQGDSTAKVNGRRAAGERSRNCTNAGSPTGNSPISGTYTSPAAAAPRAMPVVCAGSICGGPV